VPVQAEPLAREVGKGRYLFKLAQVHRERHEFSFHHGALPLVLLHVLVSQIQKFLAHRLKFGVRIIVALLLGQQADGDDDLVIVDPEHLVLFCRIGIEDAVDEPGDWGKVLAVKIGAASASVKLEQLERREGVERFHPALVLHRQRGEQVQGGLVPLGGRRRRFGRNAPSAGQQNPGKH